jgi:hypothetical protein
MRTTGRKTFGELMVGLGALVAAVFALAAVVWIDIGHMQTADDADRQAREQLAQAATAMEAMVDQVAGLRGS